VLEETENPFLADFYNGRQAPRAVAAFYLLNRHPNSCCCASRTLRQTTICDYLFDKDKISSRI